MDGSASPTAESPNPHDLKEIRTAIGSLRRSSKGLASLLQTLPFLGNILHLTAERHSWRNFALGTFFAGRPLRVWGFGELQHQSLEPVKTAFSFSSQQSIFGFTEHAHCISLVVHAHIHQVRNVPKADGKRSWCLTIHLWDHFFYFSKLAKVIPNQ